MKSLDLIARMRPTSEFVAAAAGVDVTVPGADGKSLLMWALGNVELSDRYDTTEWLLDRGCPLGAANSEGYTELHVLFGHVKHDIARDVSIAKRLIALGADVNAVSARGGLVFCEVLRITLADEELRPIYDLWFAQPGRLDFETPSSRGATPLGYARAVPYRASVLQRMEEYLAAH